MAVPKVKWISAELRRLWQAAGYLCSRFSHVGAFVSRCLALDMPAELGRRCRLAHEFLSEWQTLVTGGGFIVAALISGWFINKKTRH